MSLISAPGAPESRPEPFETDQVTIVVATRNRPDQLAATLVRHRAPVIVVDNASDLPSRLPEDAIRLDTGTRVPRFTHGMPPVEGGSHRSR